MPAFMHLLRNFIPKWCLPRPEKHLQNHIFRQLQTNHPSAALVAIKTSEQVLPKCRFMQYRRANEQVKRLGMVYRA